MNHSVRFEVTGIYPADNAPGFIRLKCNALADGPTAYIDVPAEFAKRVRFGGLVTFTVSTEDE